MTAKKKPETKHEVLIVLTDCVCDGAQYRAGQEIHGAAIMIAKKQLNNRHYKVVQR